MITPLLTTLCAILVFSCDKDKSSVPLVAKENDTIVVYNEVSYFMQGGNEPGNKKKFKIVDTACINGNNRADRNTQNGKYMYYFGAGFGFTNEQGEYIKKAFLRKRINIDYYFVSCLGSPPPGKFGFNCYEMAMNERFESKYGPAMVDSVHNDFMKFREDYLDKKYSKN